jgi:hypothetical protein
MVGRSVLFIPRLANVTSLVVRAFVAALRFQGGRIQGGNGRDAHFVQALVGEFGGVEPAAPEPIQDLPRMRPPWCGRGRQGRGV